MRGLLDGAGVLAGLAMLTRCAPILTFSTGDWRRLLASGLELLRARGMERQPA